MKLDLHQLKDVAERALSTYVQSVVGLIVAAGLTDLSLKSLEVIAVSAAPAALSILKGYLSSILPIGDASASMVSTVPPAALVPDDDDC